MLRGIKQKKSSRGSVMNYSFLLFYSPSLGAKYKFFKKMKMVYFLCFYRSFFKLLQLLR